MVCEPHLNQKKLQAIYQDAAVTVAQGLEKADIIVFLVGHTRFKAIDKKLLQGKRVFDFCGVLEEQTEHKKDDLYWPASSLSFFMSDVMIEQKYNQRVKQECS
jgi:UDP-N-acetyl-D-mannosaminuronate dehydrogenase